MDNFDPIKNLVSKENTPKIKEGINFVFEQNPEFEKVGTKEQYSEYLDTVFPESKIKDIVYHSSSELITEFKKQRDGLGQFFFSKGKDTIWKKMVSMEEEAKQVAVVLDVKNPKIELFDENDHDGQSYRMRFAKDEGYDSVFIENNRNPEDSERVVFNPSQIHILGSQSDVEAFKSFIANQSEKKDN